MATYTSNYAWTKPSGGDPVDIEVLNDNLDDQDSIVHQAFLDLAPVFSTANTYAVKDVVLYDNKVWICHTAVTTAGAWTGSTNWTQTTVGETGGTSNYNELTNHPSINGNELSGNKTGAQLGLQNTLTFDNVPTANSNNPVKSGGVYSADEAIRRWTTAEAKSVSGNPLTLTDGSARNAEGLVVTLEPIQSGSGTPSPTNVRPITGYTECVVTVKDEDETTQDTATISFGQTVYGGSVDFKTGKVTVTHGYITLDGDAGTNYGFFNPWQTQTDYKKYMGRTDSNVGNKLLESSSAAPIVISDKFQALPELQRPTAGSITSSANLANALYLNFGEESGLDTTEKQLAWLAQNPVQVCYELATPTELTLTPAELELLKGYNYITTNGTTISIAYLPDSLLAEAENYVDAKIPPAPSSDGTYVLTCTVTSGTPAYSWESAT